MESQNSGSNIFLRGKAFMSEEKTIRILSFHAKIKSLETLLYQGFLAFDRWQGHQDLNPKEQFWRLGSLSF